MAKSMWTLLSAFFYVLLFLSLSSWFGPNSSKKGNLNAIQHTVVASDLKRLCKDLLNNCLIVLDFVAILVCWQQTELQVGHFRLQKTKMATAAMPNLSLQNGPISFYMYILKLDEITHVRTQVINCLIYSVP